MRFDLYNSAGVTLALMNIHIIMHIVAAIHVWSIKFQGIMLLEVL